MVKSIIIVGYGPGISTAVADKYGAEGYTVGLVSRHHHESLLAQLAQNGVNAYFESADAGNIPDLQTALHRLLDQLGGVSVVLYNAAVLKATDILRLPPQELVQDFGVNVAGALETVQTLLNELKKTGGAVLFTGGGLAMDPHPQYGSLSIGKAGLRSLAFQLHQRLQPEGVYAGVLTITQGINEEDPIYSPQTLTGHLWQMAQKRSTPETIV